MQIVMSLFAPNSVSAEARSAREVRRVTDPNPQIAPFNLLVSGMLRWALSSYTRNPVIPLPPPVEYALSTDLEEIAEAVKDTADWQSIFTYDALAALMELNYTLRISTPLTPEGLVHPQLGPVPLGATAPEIPATIFPIIPDLEMAADDQEPIQFWNHGCITPQYEDALDAYYKQLQVNNGVAGPVGNSRPPEQARKFRSAPGPVGCPAGSESLSTYVFRDYFAMITKGAVSGARDLLKAYPYHPSGATGASGPESLSSIAENFSGVEVEYQTRPGDTIGTVAARFGLSPNALQIANPHVAALSHTDKLDHGTTLTFTTGVTPAAIAGANPDYPLNFVSGDPVRMTIKGVKHQVRTASSGSHSESLGTISSNYGLTDPGTVFTFLVSTNPPANPNANNPGILKAGAQMLIPAQTFIVPSTQNDNIQTVAAFFFGRNVSPPQVEQAFWYGDVGWFQQWILANGHINETTWDVPLVEIEPDGALKLVGTTKYSPMGSEGSLLAPDTPELVASYFVLTELNPEPYTEAFKNFTAGLQKVAPQTYAIPSFLHTVQAGDTFASLALLFGIPIDELARANAEIEGLLETLSVLALPTLDYPIAEGDTLALIATNLDLTIAELADSVESNPGILQPYVEDTNPLIIPDVPGRNTNQLISDLVTFGRYNDISGMLTRFLLHGMRVPRPDADPSPAEFPPDTKLWGLYEMSGQQFPVPEGITGPTGLPVTFRKGAVADWICFEELGGATGCANELVLRLGDEFFEDAPSLTLFPEILVGPGSLPLYRESPPHYSLQQSIHWQSSTTIPLPGPSGQTGFGGPTGQVAALPGQPSIWMFPPTLLEVAQGLTGTTASTPPYELLTSAASAAKGNTDRPLERYSWASAINIRIQRTNKEPAARYLVVGADQDGRNSLLKAWSYLQQIPFGSLYLLYPPSAASDNSQGLASDGVDQAQTFVLKANLTTVTQSNESFLLRAAAPEPSGTYYSTLAALEPFLRLLWEASVTGSGGFYLNYVNGDGEVGFPDELFVNGDVATITLLLLLESQSRNEDPDRALYSFNNCAVIGENVDSSESSLYAKLATPTANDLVRVATVPAGNAGFYLARRNPDPGGSDAIGPTSPDDQTRSLYNLVGFQVLANGDFNESNQGLPAGPVENPVENIVGPTGSEVWWYQQVLPIYKFGKVNDTPSSPALPLAIENPYAGITGPTGTPALRPLSVASIDLTFHDVYGNQTLVNDILPPVAAPVGYTDEIIGLSSWPGAAADFLFEPGSSGEVKLDTQLSLQINKYFPGSEYSFAQARSAAEADRARYAQAFYQVQQRDLNFALESNLGLVDISADALKAPLMAFVSKANVFTE
ncbi:MAG TPA: LysM domain-containing protein, partial [Pyrinomonadaceae bacterium]|nr:LysM domain-containing protein [Pyrinomonadaceae bacterium]